MHLGFEPAPPPRLEMRTSASQLRAALKFLCLKIPISRASRFDSYSSSFVAKGMGHDQGPDLDYVRPDIYFVNEDGDKEIKRTQCAERGIQYLVAERKPDGSLEVRSSTSIKAALK
jgi:hypothetical protein